MKTFVDTSKYNHKEIPVCPWCGYEHHDWQEFMTEDRDGHVQSMCCDDCGKEFQIHLHVEYTFSTEGLNCPKHVLIKGEFPSSPYVCELCKKEFYDWHIEEGKHQRLKPHQYEIYDNEKLHAKCYKNHKVYCEEVKK